MLILTRKVGESVVIGDGISVVVLAVSGNQVRLGIKAPADVRVNREEVVKRIEAALQQQEEPGRRAAERQA